MVSWTKAASAHRGVCPLRTIPRACCQRPQRRPARISRWGSTVLLTIHVSSRRSRMRRCQQAAKGSTLLMAALPGFSCACPLSPLLLAGPHPLGCRLSHHRAGPHGELLQPAPLLSLCAPEPARHRGVQCESLDAGAAGAFVKAWMQVLQVRYRGVEHRKHGWGYAERHGWSGIRAAFLPRRGFPSATFRKGISYDLVS